MTWRLGFDEVFKHLLVPDTLEMVSISSIPWLKLFSQVCSFTDADFEFLSGRLLVGVERVLENERREVLIPVCCDISTIVLVFDLDFFEDDRVIRLLLWVACVISSMLGATFESRVGTEGCNACGESELRIESVIETLSSQSKFAI